MNLARNQVAGTAWIYQRILDYCDERANGVGGDFDQTSYKLDFFGIFADAYVGGFCGCEARKRLARLGSGDALFSDFVITCEGIHQHLTNEWLKGPNRTKENTAMTRDLCNWWDAWEYAWGHFPGYFHSPRSRINKVKSELEGWMLEQGLSPRRR